MIVSHDSTLFSYLLPAAERANHSTYYYLFYFWLCCWRPPIRIRKQEPVENNVQISKLWTTFVDRSWADHYGMYALNKQKKTICYLLTAPWVTNRSDVGLATFELRRHETGGDGQRSTQFARRCLPAETDIPSNGNKRQKNSMKSSLIKLEIK